MNINEAKHKVVGNQVLYFNGINWLVRETFKTNKEAEKFIEELCLPQ